MTSSGKEIKREQKDPISTKPTHWLIDVDATLMVMKESDPIFNKSLIALLKERRVTSVSLFTRMDASNTSFGSPIRTILIDELKANGIQVDKVITPLDVMHAKASAQEFKTGDTYEKYMKPVELALQKVKCEKMERKEFARLEEVYGSKLMVATAFDFMLELDELPKEFNKKQLIDAFDSRIKKHLEEKSDQTMAEKIRNQYSNKGLDLTYLTTGFVAFLRNQLDSGIDREKLIELKNKFLTDFQEELKQTGCNQKKLNAFKEFFSERLHYRNYDYCVKINLDQSSASPTKGDVYQSWLAERDLLSSDVVIFVDDNDSEHKSVSDRHNKLKKLHKLCVLLPPKSDGFGETPPKSDRSGKLVYDCIAKEEFALCIDTIEFEKLFSQYFSGIFTNKSTLLAELEKRAVNKLNQKDYSAAIRYFEIIYLSADYLEIKKENVEKLLTKINKAKSSMGKLMPVSTDLVHDDIYRDLMNSFGFKMQLRKISLRCALHKVNHPDLYKQKKLVFPMVSRIDPEFEANVLNPVITLALQFPDQLDACKNFFLQLENSFLSLPYRVAIGRAINKIKPATIKPLEKKEAAVIPPAEDKPVLDDPSSQHLHAQSFLSRAKDASSLSLNVAVTDDSQLVQPFSQLSAQ